MNRAILQSVFATFVLAVLGHDLARAQDASVYISHRVDVNSAVARQTSLSIYRWPDLALQASRFDLPPHDALAIAPDGRELYLFAPDRVTVLDRPSLQLLRAFPIAPSRAGRYAQSWAANAQISPLRPELVIGELGNWFDVRTGAFDRTALDVAAGDEILATQLDDSGRYVSLSLSRLLPDDGVIWSVRVIDLLDTRATPIDIVDASLGVVGPDRTLVVAKNDDTNDLIVLDPVTRRERSRLLMPVGYGAVRVAGDGRGGIVAFILAARDPPRLTHWPNLQAKPVLIGAPLSARPFRSPSLRTQRGKIVLVDYAGLYCVVTCQPAAGATVIADLDQGIRLDTPIDATPVVTDVALAPLARQTEVVPATSSAATLVTVLAMLAIGGYLRRRPARENPG